MFIANILLVDFVKFEASWKLNCDDESEGEMMSLPLQHALTNQIGNKTEPVSGHINKYANAALINLKYEVTLAFTKQIFLSFLILGSLTNMCNHLARTGVNMCKRRISKNPSGTLKTRC